jgi:hypothetical protein
LQSIYPLIDNFGLMIEHDGLPRNNSHSFVSFIHLDFYRMTCTKFQTNEFLCESARINVNTAEPTEFVLILRIGDLRFLRICKIEKTRMIIGDPFELDFYSQSYFNGYLYGLKWFEVDDYLLVCF